MISDLYLTLRTARRRTGFIQKDVAHLMGMSSANIAAIEQGKQPPSVKQLCELSIIYNVEPSVLLGEMLIDNSADIAARLSTLPDRKIRRLIAPTRRRKLKDLEVRLEKVMLHNS